MAFARNELGSAGADSSFDSVFGKAGITNEQVYYDPIRGINKLGEIGKKHLESMQKAKSAALTKGPLDFSSGGTFTGYGLMPPFVDPQVVDRSIRQTPLALMLRRRAVRGRAYVYNILSSKAGADFIGDDGALSVQEDTRSSATVTMKFLYAVGRVTGPAMAAGQGFLNLLEEDLRVKSASMLEALENEIVNGDVSSDALGFDGLRASITTNSTSNSGAALSLENIRDDMATVFNANGNVDLIVLDAATHNKVKGLLMDFQRNVERPSGNLAFGIPDAFMFDGALVIKDRYMPTTAGSREALFLDTRYIELAVLQDITYEELAKNNDSVKYMLKWYGALIVSAEGLMAKRTSLE